MAIAFLFVCILLLVGVALRESIAVFRWSYIPASVIAGFLGLAIVQFLQQADPTSAVSSVSEVIEPASTNWNAATWADELVATLKSWPGFLIAVVFAGMLLERKAGSAKESARRVGRQGLMVWIIVLGETLVGLLATWLIVQQFADVPNSFGMLIETGFAGGHGTAGAMGEVFAHPSVNLASGRDLGMLMATCGLVYGIVSGIVWINVGLRFGWATKPKEEALGQITEEETPIGYAKISQDTVEPLLFQVLWLALAFAIGLAMQAIVVQAAATIDGWFVAESVGSKAEQQLSKRLSVSNVADFPLFIYTLFGGLIVRWSLGRFNLADRIDSKTIGRLCSGAMDILVVAAIASLNLQAVQAMLVPFSILFVTGCVWTAVCLLVISRLVLPRDHWFQLGLINYGMSTGTTATGFVLLRMIDPKLESGAAEDYALAAPLSAPFIGGGIATIALPLLVLEKTSIMIPTLVIGAVVVMLIAFGIRIGRTAKCLSSVSIPSEISLRHSAFQSPPKQCPNSSRWQWDVTACSFLFPERPMNRRPFGWRSRTTLPCPSLPIVHRISLRLRVCQMHKSPSRWPTHRFPSQRPIPSRRPRFAARQAHHVVVLPTRFRLACQQLTFSQPTIRSKPL